MEYFHLTTPQRNIWNLQKYYDGTAIANLCGAIFFQERRDSALLCEALCWFIRSQSGIRLRFCDGEEPMQYVAEEADEAFPVRSFRSREEFDAFAEDCAKKPIGLSDENMYRFVVFHLEQEDRSGVLAVLSHLVADAWTFGLMAHQVDAAYRWLAGEDRQKESGAFPALSEVERDRVCLPKGDYADFIRSENGYLTSERYEKDRGYWEEKYPVRPEESPIKLRAASADSVEAGRITRNLPHSLEQGIISYCGSHPVTEAVLFETALVIYLSRINPDVQAVTVGVPVLNRANAREKQIAGMFVSTMPLTVAVAEDTEIAEVESRITKGHMELFRHQKYPYGSILRQLREKQDFSGNLYDVMVSYQNARTKTGADTRWYSNGCSEVPLLVHIDNRDGKDSHVINVDFQLSVFRDRAEVELLIDRLEYILGQIVSGRAERVGEIGIVPPKEKDRILYEFNNTYVEYPREKCVHELFMEQAAKVVGKVAVFACDRSLTYIELNEQSNKIAYSLIEGGVKVGDIVALFLPRKSHLIAAILDILKAGAAYLPIDSNYPNDRIEYMLKNTNAKYCIDEYNICYMLKNKHIANVNLPMSCENPFCCMFTSGSTGKPKGVTLLHKNIINYFLKNIYVNRLLECKTVFCISNFIFDMFINEVFSALLFGMSLVLPNEIDISVPYNLANLINKYKIESIICTPTKFRCYLNNIFFRSALSNVKLLIFGGEILTEDLCENVLLCSNAIIFNGYGPTETTIVSSYGIVAGNDITIGTPIANTQIYILDRDLRPVPIGVPGELCIAGEGVGLGYLNRPELTAERFVPNPFATEDNHHGKTMYRTGDLARFRSDGEIEYLGRMDTQVKIRGLRIELGEIESVMGSFPGVGLCAVADKRDETGRQYLVGYDTLADGEEHNRADTFEAKQAADLDEKALRAHLSAKLPKYMVPNYFMRLDAMPMTASGKTDRKNLPEPVVTRQEREYVPPVTEREKELCRLMGEVLHVEQVGVTDDFFALGGDSLTAIEFLAKTQDRGISFALQNVFDHPTVRELCDHMDAGAEEKILYEPADFDRYRELLSRNVVDEAFVPVRRTLGNVLLTGATGFLGAHVLDALYREESGKIYCLVRGGKEGCASRLRETLRYYFGDRYEAEFEGEPHRIVPVDGDIESETLAAAMPEDVQTVIHTAASVKHYGSYAYFHRVNVEGTKHVIKYAKSTGARLIHISTLSVSGNSLVDAFAVYRSEEEKFFDETSLYIGQPLDNVYIHSKFEAERAVFDAMLAGMDAKVVRVGNLTSRASDYKFQPNYKENAFLARFKAILEFGLFPDYLMHLYSEFSPVDLTAEGVVKIAQYADRQTVFHLNSNRPIYFNRFLEVVHGLGISMEVVDGERFAGALRATVRDRVTEYIFEAFQNDMDGQGRLVYDSNIHIENDFTVWFLRKLGLEWNEINMEYIRGYVEYFRGIGYLRV